MSVDKKISEAISCFNEIYLDGIPIIIRDKTAFLSFMCILTGIEALSGYCYDESEVRKRFKDFICNYFPENYKSLVENLWTFRNKMVHAFSPASFVLVHNMQNKHFKKHSDGRLILNAENFFQAFSSAAKQYFNDVLRDPSLQVTMLKRLDDLHNGGSICVFPLNYTTNSTD